MGRRASTWGYVNIIKSSNGLYKIGLACNVQRRLREHQKAHPGEKLELIRVIETDNMLWTERQLHSIFDRKRAHGEWFALNKADFRYVDKIEQSILAYIDDIR